MAASATLTALTTRPAPAAAVVARTFASVTTTTVITTTLRTGERRGAG